MDFWLHVLAWNLENAGRANGIAYFCGFGRNEIFRVFMRRSPDPLEGAVILQTPITLNTPKKP